MIGNSGEDETVDAISSAGPDAVVDRIDAFLENPALSQGQVRDVYNKWSSTYEQDLSRIPQGYNNPRQLRDLFVSLLSNQIPLTDWKQLRILDVACGTGLVGARLWELGFKRLDGVDGSERMLEMARAKGIYENLNVELIGDRPVKFAPPRSYDALLTTGTFCPRHLEPSCLRHLGALVKPGGLVCIGMRKKFCTDDPVLRNMEPELLRLQSDGLWDVLLWEERECYYDDQPGMYFVLRVK